MTAELRCVECSDGRLILMSGPYGMFYGCTNKPQCKGSLGARKHWPYAPLGVPADKETKALRIAVHQRIDPLWRGKPREERSRIYAALSALVGKPYHTAEADAATCQRIIELFDSGWRP